MWQYYLENVGENWIVIDMGNPWVNLRLPLPVSIYTRTPEARVWVYTGFPKGTDKGMLPMGTGTDIQPMDTGTDFFKKQL
jgi:hypothetical protein